MTDYDDSYLISRKRLQDSLTKLCPHLIVDSKAFFRNDKWHFGVRLKLKNDIFLIHGNRGCYISDFDCNYWLGFLRLIRSGKNGFLEDKRLDDIVEVSIELNFLPHQFNIHLLNSLGVPVNTEYSTRFFQASLYVSNARYISNLNFVKSVKLINQNPRL